MRCEGPECRILSLEIELNCMLKIYAIPKVFNLIPFLLSTLTYLFTTLSLKTKKTL
ncbi:hypothetical protein FHW36_11175 [Chitinophaga polysaccharea]|uniref:Uncharacterized protein n=1 Tax=Chitinophaga polysaccharea TaxID=1293035 RepID=A0A561P6X8_9BACT|nr:hypothetical protein FHW36_11175 [Chitinophaga polysaccharea]